MPTPSIRVLVVEDYEPFRRSLRSTLQKRPELRVVGEVSDGLEAVQKVQTLQPDLIVLDIGIPTLHGIEVARRAGKISPQSKILFVSQEISADVVQEALNTGAGGYVVKADAGRELLHAVEAVLQGKLFLSIGVAGRESGAPMHDRGAAITYSHEVAFYADDSSLVDGYARFIESSLKGGNAVIVVVTESHRGSLLPKLQADGVDIPAAMEQGRYILLDAADTVSRLTVNDMPDPVRCTREVGNLIMESAKAITDAKGRVAVCGEIAPTLLSKGSAEGAIELEKLWDEITKIHGVHTLCGYLSSTFPRHESDPVFQRICAEHSAVHGREVGAPG